MLRCAHIHFSCIFHDFCCTCVQNTNPVFVLRDAAGQYSCMFQCTTNFFGDARASRSYVLVSDCNMTQATEKVCFVCICKHQQTSLTGNNIHVSLDYTFCVLDLNRGFQDYLVKCRNYSRDSVATASRSADRGQIPFNVYIQCIQDWHSGMHVTLWTLVADPMERLLQIFASLCMRWPCCTFSL